MTILRMLYVYHVARGGVGSLNVQLQANIFIHIHLLQGKTFLCIYNSMCLYSDFLYISANIG